MRRVTPKAAADTTPAPTPRSWSRALAWLLPLAAALALLGYTTRERVSRVRYVTGLAEWSGGAGGAGWSPRLVVPEHNNSSYEWLDQVRQMADRGEWRVRHIDYENAPYGREVFAPSPYRWWLFLVAGIDHLLEGGPVGASIERAALVADPILLALFTVGTAAFAARRLGALASATVSLGACALFPFATQFLPGMPDDPGLSAIVGVWSLLLLVLGLRVLHSEAPDAAAAARRWFVAAGVAGGLGLWVSVEAGAPLLGGVALGALAAAWVARGGGPAAATPWRAWGLAGASTVLAAYLIEGFPSHMGFWELRAVHPVLGLAFLGAGELLAQASERIGGLRSSRPVRDAAMAVLGLAAVAGVPATLYITKTWGFLELQLHALRLAPLPDAVTAPNLGEWIRRDGLSPAVWATLLPLALVAGALWLVMRRGSPRGGRIATALALGPVAVALGFACSRVQAWNAVDGALLVLLTAAAAYLGESGIPAMGRWTWAGVSALVLVPGILQSLPSESGPANALNQTEVVSLIERDLAHWLKSHSGADSALVLATPNQTTTLYYFGGIRGLGTLDWENRDGLGAAIRILSALTPEESYELIHRRGVTHIIIPSWDAYLEVYTRLGLGKIEGSFMERLQHWVIPPWLRPVAYLLPSIEGFSDQTVLVFEVVDDQDDAAAGSRLAEYFIDSGQLELAGLQAQNLRRFPGDLGALVARAQVEVARGETGAFGRTVATLMGRLSAGGDRRMLWDRRVSLSIVLAQAQHLDASREQLSKCLSTAHPEDLRSLSTATLYHMQVLARALGMGFKDPAMKALSLQLLPPDVRAKLGPESVQ